MGVVAAIPVLTRQAGFELGVKVRSLVKILHSGVFQVQQYAQHSSECVPRGPSTAVLILIVYVHLWSVKLHSHLTDLSGKHALIEADSKQRQ